MLGLMEVVEKCHLYGFFNSLSEIIDEHMINVKNLKVCILLCTQTHTDLLNKYVPSCT